MSIEHSIVNDVSVLKSTIWDNRKEIAQYAKYIETLLTDLFDHLEKDGDEIKNKITTELEQVKNALSSLDNIEPYLDSFFDEIINEGEKTIDPVINELRNLGDEFDIQDIPNLIDLSLPDVDIPDIPGLNKKFLENILKIDLDELSISLKDLPTSSHSPQDAQSQSATDTENNSSFSDEFQGILENFLKENKTTLDLIETKIETFINQESVSKLLTLSQPFPDQITTKTLFQFIRNEFLGEIEHIEAILNDFIDFLFELIDDAKGLFVNFLNESLESKSTLIELYKALTNSKENPTIIELFSYFAAIPLFISSKFIAKEPLDLSVNIFPQESEENPLFAADGGVKIGWAIMDFIYFFSLQHYTEKANEWYQSSTIGDGLKKPEAFYSNYYHIFTFFSCILPAIRLTESILIFPSLRRESSGLPQDSQGFPYFLKILDSFIAIFDQFTQYNYINNCKREFERIAKQRQGNTQKLINNEESDTDEDEEISIPPKEIPWRYQMRLGIGGFIMLYQTSFFIYQRVTKKDGEAFDPRIRINFFFEPTSIILENLKPLHNSKFLEDKKIIKAIIENIGICFDIVSGSFYIDAFWNPYPGTPRITQSDQTLSVNFADTTGRYQNINSDKIQIQWEEFKSNGIGTGQGTGFTPTDIANFIKVKVNYDQYLFNDDLFAYYNLPILKISESTNGTLTVSFKSPNPDSANIVDQTIQWQNYSNGSWTDIASGTNQTYDASNNTNAVRVKVTCSLSLTETNTIAYSGDLFAYPTPKLITQITVTTNNSVQTITLEFTGKITGPTTLEASNFVITSNSPQNIQTIDTITSNDLSMKTSFMLTLNNLNADTYIINFAPNIFTDQNGDSLSGEIGRFTIP